MKSSRQEAWKQERECTNKDNCFNLSCAFFHPGGASRSGLTCKSGDKCWNIKCHYRHPSGSSRQGLHSAKGGTPSAQGICRFSRCMDPACVYMHPGQSRGTSSARTRNERGGIITEGWGLEHEQRRGAEDSSSRGWTTQRSGQQRRGNNNRDGRNGEGRNGGRTAPAQPPPSSYLTPSFTEQVLMLDLKSAASLETMIDAKFRTNSPVPGPDYADFWKSHLMCEVQAQLNGELALELIESKKNFSSQFASVVNVNHADQTAVISFSNPVNNFCVDGIKTLLYFQGLEDGWEFQKEFARKKKRGKGNIVNAYQRCCQEFDEKAQALPSLAEEIPPNSVWTLVLLPNGSVAFQSETKDPMLRITPTLENDHLMVRVLASSPHFKLNNHHTAPTINVLVGLPAYHRLPSFETGAAVVAIKAKNLVCYSRNWDGLVALSRPSSLSRLLLLTPPSLSPGNAEMQTFAAEDLYWHLPEAYRQHLMGSVNTAQLTSVRLALGFSWAQVVGPPGSGKTFTALHILNSADLAFRCQRGAFNPGNKVDSVHMAVVAPSNEAVDQLLTRLLKNRFTTGRADAAGGAGYLPFIVRVGNEDKMADNISGNEQLNVHAIVRELLEIRWQGGKESPVWRQRLEAEMTAVELKLKEVEEAVGRYANELEGVPDTTKFGPVTMHMHSLLQQRLRLNCRRNCLLSLNLFRFPNQAKKMLVLLLVEAAELVVGTVSSLGGVRGYCEGQLRKFDMVLVDEACQLKECEAVLPMLNCSRVLQMGDPRQLGPTVIYRGRHRAALDRSLFERVLASARTPSVILDQQYRMHPDISAFPSSFFYSSKLQNSVPASEFEHPAVKQLYEKFSPYQFMDIKGMEIRENNSIMNKEEAALVVSIVAGVVAALSGPYSSGVLAQPRSIGIITPYSAQKMLLRQNLPPMPANVSCSVDTVDAFQGAERDVIILSCVRSNSAGELGFLTNPNRLNVALTRAKFCLCIVGCASSLGSASMWASLIADAHKRGRLLRSK